MTALSLSLSDLFFAGPQHEVMLSAGKTLLPCHFKEVHYCLALFRTSREALDKILSGTGLVPALRWGNQYVVALGLIRYTQSDLGAYDEVIPHMTVAQADDPRDLDQIEAEFAAKCNTGLPIRTHVTEIVLFDNATGIWRRRAIFPLSRA